MASAGLSAHAPALAAGLAPGGRVPVSSEPGCACWLRAARFCLAEGPAVRVLSARITQGVLSAPMGAMGEFGGDLEREVTEQPRDGLGTGVP